MIQAPVDKVLVKVKSVFNRYVSDITKTAFAEVHDADINPADFVTIVGEVVSVPRKISNLPYLKGFSTENIRVGDTAIFSYQVIFSFDISEVEKKFKNCFWYKGQEYWAADIYNVFGVIRDGGIQMVNGYCMLEGLKPVTSIIMPASSKQTLNVAEAKVTHLSRKDGLSENILPMDTVFYNPLKVQKYTVGGKEIGIIERKHLMGVKISDYSDLQLIN